MIRMSLRRNDICILVQCRAPATIFRGVVARAAVLTNLPLRRFQTNHRGR